MNLRPVGHITDNLRELDKWRARRCAKQLDNKALITAIRYLQEYRALLFHVDKLQRRLAQHDGCSRFSAKDYQLLSTELKVIE